MKATDTIPPAAGDRAGWLARLARLGESDGYFHALGDRHWALFTDAAPTLIVSFETFDEASARPDGLPLAHGIATAHGWSHLAMLADGATWWRDPAVWRYFDRLVDDAFFEDFDRVLFFGAGAGGHAACAYSVAAPGATVLAFAPRATMDPEQAGWDNRQPEARRLDFRSRFGYAPDMVEGVDRLFLAFDPRETFDAMHASLFRAPWVTRLPMRFAGPRPASMLDGIGALAPVIEAAAEGRLSPEEFNRLWRGRRDHLPWLTRVLRETDDAGRMDLSRLLCRNVTARMEAPKFARRLEQLGTGPSRRD